MGHMLTPKELAELAAKAKAERASAEQALASQNDQAANIYINAEYTKAVAKIPAILEKAAIDGKNEAVVYSWEILGYSTHSKEDGIISEKLKAHLEEQGFTIRIRNFEKKAIAIDRMHEWGEMIASW
jgi:16S rRNA C1402 N4-methylase RsmH